MPIRSRDGSDAGDVFGAVAAPVAKRRSRAGFCVERSRQQLLVGELLTEPASGIGAVGAGDVVSRGIDNRNISSGRECLVSQNRV